MKERGDSRIGSDIRNCLSVRMDAGEARPAGGQKGVNGARGQRFRAPVLHSYDVMAHYANAAH